MSAQPRERDKEQGSVTPCSGDTNVLLDGIRIGSCGVDTVSFAWRLGSGPLSDAVSAAYYAGEIVRRDTETGELHVCPVRASSASGISVLADVVCGGRVMFVHGELLWIEGRLAALLDGDKDAVGLGDPRLLADAASRCASAIEGLLGVSGCLGRATVRRLDLATEVHFEPRLAKTEGDAFLRALAAMDAPRRSTQTWKHKGRTMTVYWRAPKSNNIGARSYDKGVESRSHAPGERVRMEAQVRWQGKRRPDIADLDGAAIYKLIGQRFGHLLASEDVLIAPLSNAQAELMSRTESGELPATKCVRLAGVLALRAQGAGRDWWKNNATARSWSRNSKELRELGIALDEAAPPAKIPVGMVLRAADTTWREMLGLPGPARRTSPHDPLRGRNPG